jgi:hypothetical protein
MEYLFLAAIPLMIIVVLGWCVEAMHKHNQKKLVKPVDWLKNHDYDND